MNISKLEDKAYRMLKANNFIVFKIKDLEMLLKIDKIKAYNLIKALKNKKIIKKEKGFFYFSDTDEFVIASNVHFPSYVSFWSALNYYGFSDNTPKKIFLVTTKYSKETGSFKYICLSKKRFFGYTSVGSIVIAEKEKAIIDSLLFPKYAGGIKEIKSCLDSAFNCLDKNKLIEYAIKMGNKAVIRRLGFLLEEKGFKSLSKLKKNIGKGYELLDPTLSKKNNLNKTWLLDINI
jgi:predicted transcriptional regulator of viral defense system